MSFTIVSEQIVVIVFVYFAGEHATMSLSLTRTTLDQKHQNNLIHGTPLLSVNKAPLLSLYAVHLCVFPCKSFVANPTTDSKGVVSVNLLSNVSKGIKKPNTTPVSANVAASYQLHDRVFQPCGTTDLLVSLRAVDKRSRPAENRLVARRRCHRLSGYGSRRSRSLLRQPGTSRRHRACYEQASGRLCR